MRACHLQLATGLHNSDHHANCHDAIHHEDDDDDYYYYRYSHYHYHYHYH